MYKFMRSNWASLAIVFLFAGAPANAQTSGLSQLESQGRVVDYLVIRQNLLNFANSVSSLAAANGWTAIQTQANNYITSAGPAFTAAVSADIYTPSSQVQFSVPTPNLLAPWTVQGNNILAAGIPVYTCGYIWTYGDVDTSYSLYNLGLNSEFLLVGPVDFVTTGNSTTGYGTLVSNIPSAFSAYIRWADSAASAGEVIDILTDPGYPPSWFSTWEQNNGLSNSSAWMDTAQGRALLDQCYQGDYIAFGNQPSVKTMDLANEWTFWSAGATAQTNFPAWLTTKYGTISALNSSWSTSYSSFGAVPIPAYTVATTPSYPYTTRAPLWDWCNYNTAEAATVAQWMYNDFHQQCPGFLVHLKGDFSSYSETTLAANFINGTDPQQIIPIMDLIGTDDSEIRGSTWIGTLFQYDYMKSICPNKPIFSSEMHAVPYSDSTAGAEIRRGLFQRCVHGERMNLIYLCSALSKPSDWNLTENGWHWNIGEWPNVVDLYGQTSADLRRLVSPIDSFAGRAADVLIFYDNAADFGVPGSSHPGGSYEANALLVYQSLIYRDVKVGFVTESMLAQQIPTQKLLILAGAQYVSNNTVTCLQNYINAGGHIVWIGNNLGYDQYGNSRSSSSYSGIYNSSNCYVKNTQSTATGYSSYWASIFSSVGISPAFATGSSSSPTWGVEIRSMLQSDGSYLIFLANTNSTSVQFALQYSGPTPSLTDLITGQTINPASISMSGDQVLILSTAMYNISGNITLGNFTGGHGFRACYCRRAPEQRPDRKQGCKPEFKRQLQRACCPERAIQHGRKTESLAALGEPEHERDL